MLEAIYSCHEKSLQRVSRRSEVGALSGLCQATQEKKSRSPAMLHDGGYGVSRRSRMATDTSSVLPESKAARLVANLPRQRQYLKQYIFAMRKLFSAQADAPKLAR